MQGMSPYNQQPNPQPMQYRTYSVEEKFGVLRGIASLFRGLAILALILMGISIVGMILTQPSYRYSYSIGSIIISIGVAIISGLVLAIYFEAISQGIKLFISIEHNQRVQSEYMRQLVELNRR